MRLPRHASRWIAALTAVLLIGLGSLVLAGVFSGWATSLRWPVPAPTTTEGGVVVEVAWVTDGDTIRVILDDTSQPVRIIGIDAPELRGQECLAQEATEAVEQLAAAGSVRITADDTQDDRDRYGRILRHVWTLDGRSVGYELIGAGLAVEYTYDRPYAGAAAYRAAERQARSADLGIWGAQCDAAARG